MSVAGEVVGPPEVRSTGRGGAVGALHHVGQVFHRQYPAPEVRRLSAEAGLTRAGRGDDVMQTGSQGVATYCWVLTPSE